MYLIERIVKLLQNKKEAPEIKEEQEECEHIFLPIDSSCEYLACSKCGLIIKNSLK
ncbi:MAG: hypothetical protein PHX18_03755 [Candidatus Gastranaerophilales bacterium]|nr:hypothetical protein [Candidatus Gastranaerophilales bacterium]